MADEIKSASATTRSASAATGDTTDAPAPVAECPTCGRPLDRTLSSGDTRIVPGIVVLHEPVNADEGDKVPADEYGGAPGLPVVRVPLAPVTPVTAVATPVAVP